MQIVNKKKSLYVQLLILLIISAAFSGILFFLLNTSGKYLIDICYFNSEYSHSDYLKKKNEKYIFNLQQYVNKYKVNSKDTQMINRWVKPKGMISLEIYQENILVYDSEYSNEEAIWEENIKRDTYDWNEYYTVQFINGQAMVSIYVDYEYRFYHLASSLELSIAFLVFLILVIFGIRRKMNYILTLNKEIELLEGGNLDYPITIKGNDELTLLANGLDCMRKSFQEQVIQENCIMQKNQQIITEMSHDLRTPITTIMLYTEILKKGAYQDNRQLYEYLNRIDGKTHQMKQLTDNFFEYSLVTGENKIQLEEAQTCEVLFYDLFSETYSYLEQKGFQVNVQIEWSTKKIEIYTDYIIRIMDNITSNLIKYANPCVQISFFSLQENNQVGFMFVNGIRQAEEKIESTGIGIQSIKNMMTKMGGECIVHKSNKIFQIRLLFPYK